MGEMIQADRWNPVYITLADSQPRNVLLEFRAPHGSFYGMRSRQIVTIGPQAQTFIVYMPLRHFMEGDLSFVVRDPGTRRRLADYPGGPYLAFGGAKHVSPGIACWDQREAGDAAAGHERAAGAAGARTSSRRNCQPARSGMTAWMCCSNAPD